MRMFKQEMIMDWNWASYLVGVATPLVIAFVFVVYRRIQSAYRVRKELKDLWGRGS